MYLGSKSSESKFAFHDNKSKNSSSTFLAKPLRDSNDVDNKSLVLGARSKSIQRKLFVGSSIVTDFGSYERSLAEKYPDIARSGKLKRIFKKRFDSIVAKYSDDDETYSFPSEEVLLKDIAVRLYTIEGAKIVTENTKFRKNRQSKINGKKGGLIHNNRFISLYSDENITSDLLEVMKSKNTELDCNHAADLASVYGVIKALGEKEYKEYMIRKGNDPKVLTYATLPTQESKISVKKHGDKVMLGDHIYIENSEDYQDLDDKHIGSLVGQHGFMGSGGLYAYPKSKMTVNSVEKKMIDDFEERTKSQIKDNTKDKSERKSNIKQSEKDFKDLRASGLEMKILKLNISDMITNNNVK